MLGLLQLCESLAYFKQEHKKFVVFFFFFNTLVLSCGHLSVLLSSLFKHVVQDSQLSRNEISFPQQGLEGTLRTGKTWTCWSGFRGGPWKWSSFEERLEELELFSLEKRKLHWGLIEAFQHLEGACKKDGSKFLAGAVMTGQGVMVLSERVLDYI